MYGSNVSEDGLQYVSGLNFGDPFRKHEMRCRWLIQSLSILLNDISFAVSVLLNSLQCI